MAGHLARARRVAMPPAKAARGGGFYGGQQLGALRASETDVSPFASLRHFTEFVEAWKSLAGELPMPAPTSKAEALREEIIRIRCAALADTEFVKARWPDGSRADRRNQLAQAVKLIARPHVLGESLHSQPTTSDSGEKHIIPSVVACECGHALRMEEVERGRGGGERRPSLFSLSGGSQPVVVYTKKCQTGCGRLY